MKKITALIPARGGSKGVPRKNIKLLGGTPLISYSIKACMESNYIDRIIVSTEDEEIAYVAKKLGAEVPFMRPDNLAQDKSTDYEVLQHFFTQVKVGEVALVRPTTPLRKSTVIDAAVEIFRNLEDSTSMRSVHELPESPYKFFKIGTEGFCEGLFDDFKGIKDYTNLPRQTFPKVYHPNGYIDIIKKETIVDGSTYGKRISPFFTEVIVEIDTKEQFDLIELYLSKERGIMK